jgi:hypothetical protein
MSNETYDYIDRLMQQARKGRVVEHTTRVKFERPELPNQSEWRQQALEALVEWRNKQSWAAVYLNCGRCYRGFIEWLEANPAVEPLDEWLSKAKSIIAEKRWI